MAGAFSAAPTMIGDVLPTTAPSVASECALRADSSSISHCSRQRRPASVTAIFFATVLGFPAPWKHKLLGLAVDDARGNGVTVGDLFEVLRTEGHEPFGDTEWQPVAVIQIVHVRERSATGLVTAVFDLGIEAGAPVRLTRKMPS